MYHAYPRVIDWPGKLFPDEVNPRSHADECLVGSLPKAIEETLRENPSSFEFVNRGALLLVDKLRFHPSNSKVYVTLTNNDSTGLADGATTDAVIAKLQRKARTDPLLRAQLAKARFHVEIIEGLDERALLSRIVLGRNTSRQVKSWTIADFNGVFDWLKDLLEREDGPFRGRVGYEENSGNAVKILHIISYLTCFHPVYNEHLTDGGQRAPTAAYCSAGIMDKRFADDTWAPGYKALKPVAEDILKLHDHLHINFHVAYDRWVAQSEGKQGKLGGRSCIESHLKDGGIELPLTRGTALYGVPDGLIYPLLASFRALLKFRVYGGELRAEWKTQPRAVFDVYGSALMCRLMEQLKFFNGNPNAVGKSRLVYASLHDQMQVIASQIRA